MAGAEVARPWLREAGATFLCVVDVDGALTARFGLGVVSATFLFDEEAMLVAPILRLDPADEDHAGQLEGWVRGGQPPRVPARTERPVEVGSRQALAWRRLAELALAEGDVTAATASLDEAWRLEPDNMQVRKQRWALRNPERFYEGDIDRDWQKRQLEHGL